MSVKNLHDIDIYHRDIKPDNFFMFGNTWKIGDLGLIAHRHEEQKHRGLLGPKGFMSPESTNKCYAYNDLADKAIDEKSDLFQIGKLFWYILQGDVPTGQTLADDYIDADKRVYNNVLLQMLHYSKTRRANIEAIERALTPICFDYAAL